MKKSVKIGFAILAVLLVVLLIDTVQAKIFNNRPFLKITEDYNGGNVYQKDKGILVDTYNFSDGEKKTVFRWEKYTPPVDLETNKEKSFLGKVVEATDSYIIVEPNKEYFKIFS